MPLYRIHRKGEPANKARLIKANDKSQAAQHFLGRHELEIESITDPAAAVELVESGLKVEKAGESEPAPGDGDTKAEDPPADDDAETPPVDNKK